jgi:site-specific DNA-methyltransferase (adenine-specific)
MPDIPDASIDMTLCDLPYGTTQCSWDTIIPFEPLWDQYKRIIKPNGAIVLTASQPFTSVLGISNIEWLRYSWVWQKTAPTGHLNAHNMPMRDHEDILVFYNARPTYNAQGLRKYKRIVKRGSNGICYGDSGKENLQEYTNYPRSVISISSEGDTEHPTQKPVALFEYLIRTYSNEGEVVLDNCIGSGTTAVAAIRTGRHYIGIEISEEYCSIARERIRIER